MKQVKLKNTLISPKEIVSLWLRYVKDHTDSHGYLFKFGVNNPNDVKLFLKYCDINGFQNINCQIRDYVRTFLTILNKDEVDRRVHIFESFLKENDCLSEFYDMIQQNGLYVKYVREELYSNPRGVFIGGFTWRNAPRGFDFWNNKDRLWTQTCQKNNW